MPLRTLLLAALLAPAAAAQPSLLTPTTPFDLTPRQAELLSALERTPGVGAATLVEADLDLLAGPGAVRLALPGGLDAVFDPARVERRSADDVSWAGRTRSRAARPGQVVLVARGSGLTGTVWVGGEVFEIRPLTDGLHAVAPLATAALPDHDDGYDDFEAGQPAVEAPPPAPTPGAAAATTIDVLVAYTADVAAAYADPVAFAQAAVDASNLATDNSATTVPRQRLMLAYETPTAPTSDMYADLPALAGTSDGRFDEVHGLRDTYGADLVALLGPSSGVYGACGLGYINSSATSAFTVTAYNCAVGNLSYAHEVGHNMGLRHNPETDPTTTPYAYGHGKVQNEAGGQPSWRTVMAYNDCSSSPCTRSPFWSNPDVTYLGSPAGDVALRDNARVLDERGATVAAFRSASPAPEISVSPAALAVTVGSGGSASETVTVANVAPAGALPLDWTASLQNLDDETGTPVDGCEVGETISQTARDFYTTTSGSGTMNGQSFTAPCTGQLLNVAPAIYANQYPGNAWTGTLYLYEGEGTGGPQLAAVPVSVTNPSSEFYLEVAFPTPVEVDAGESYTWFLEIASGTTALLYSTSDPLAGGDRYSGPSPGAASASTGDDMQFLAELAPPDLWASIAPAAGSADPGASDDLTVTFSAAGFPDGTYTGDLVVASNDPATPSVTVSLTLTVGSGASTSIVVAGSRGNRYFGPPAEGVTVDDLAAQNLVRGVPGYFPGAPVTLWTRFDPVAKDWVPSQGAGEALELGRAFRWYLLDRDGVGDPEVSESVALPFTLSTDLPANESDVVVELDTDGNRFNFLANPFGVDLDVTQASGWPGAAGIRSAIFVYDEGTAAWELATGPIAPWEAFRFRARGPRRNGNPRLLLIPSPLTAPATDREAAPAAPGLTFRLEGRDETGRPLADGMLALRFSDDATAAFSAEEADVEKFQVPSTRYALLGARVGGTFAGLDARPFEPAEIPLALEARGATPAFTLRWDASALPAGLPVALVDLATGVEVDVRAQSSYAFEAPSRPALADVPTADLADGARATDRFVLRIGDGLAAAEAAPEALSLEAPAPNPTASTARVAFAVPEAGTVRLAVYDVRGREVAVLAEGRVEAGRHEAALDAAGLAAGVYVVRLEADGRVLTRRATVVR